MSFKHTLALLASIAFASLVGCAGVESTDSAEDNTAETQEALINSCHVGCSAYFADCTAGCNGDSSCVNACNGPTDNCVLGCDKGGFPKGGGCPKSWGCTDIGDVQFGQGIPYTP